jgi:hypothetical protein
MQKAILKDIKSGARMLAAIPSSLAIGPCGVVKSGTVDQNIFRAVRIA